MNTWPGHFVVLKKNRCWHKYRFIRKIACKEGRIYMAVSKEEKCRRNHEFHNSTIIVMTKMITRGSLSFSITIRD